MTTAMVEEVSTTRTTADVLTHLAKCGECAVSVEIQRTTSGGGFTLVNCGENVFGVGPNGLPTCPEGHGEMALADEQLPAHDAIAKAAEMQQASLPGVFPPFNYEGAYLELAQKAAEVSRLKDEWDADKEQAAASKKAWEKAAELLTKMGVEFERRRREKANPVTEPENVGGEIVPCLFEQRNPQVPCPLCDRLPAFLDAADVMPRDSESHVEQAESELARRAANDLSEALEDAGLIIEPRIILTWNTDQREQVQAWLLTRSDLRPPVLGTAHIAADVSEGDANQVCKECGTVLLNGIDQDGTEPWKPGTLVGTDCEGAGQSYPKSSGRKKSGRR